MNRPPGGADAAYILHSEVKDILSHLNVFHETCQALGAERDRNFPRERVPAWQSFSQKLSGTREWTAAFAGVTKSAILARGARLRLALYSNSRLLPDSSYSRLLNLYFFAANGGLTRAVVVGK
jgi:hypothetical protein